MLLAFDVGNTNIVMGLYSGKDLKGSWRMETNQKKSADEYAVFIRQLFEVHNFTFDQVDDVIISTVVPSMTYTLQHMSRYYFSCEPIIVGPGVKTGLIVKYDNPKMLGADRIVNSVAALAKYKAPLIIIDFGTATTFGIIDENNTFKGGLIIPGVKTSLNALSQRASQLPSISISKPQNLIGRNTLECMQSGILYGTASMIDGLIDRLKASLPESVNIVATGGMAKNIVPYCRHKIVLDEYLLLKGLFKATHH